MKTTLGPLLCLLLLLNACGKNQFGSKTPSPESSKPPAPSSVKPGADKPSHANADVKAGRHTWQVRAERAALDLVVIPDTSGGETIHSDNIVNQKVSLQSRLETLASGVAKSTDLKILLIAPSRATNMNLGIDVSEFKHPNSAQVEIDSSISGSYLLALSSVASCAAAATRTIAAASADPRLGSSQVLEVCGLLPSAGIITGLNMEKMLVTAGKLANQFRFGAKRAYLFLSNNKPAVFLKEDFLKVFKAAGMTLPAVFSFHNNSEDYRLLSQMTGGLDFVYNQVDWTKSFESLAQKLISVAGTEATLPVTEITALKGPFKIKGVEVSDNCFSAHGNKISVSAQCIKDLKVDSAQVEVGYSYR